MEPRHRELCRIPPGILIVSCINKDYLPNYLESKTGTAIGYGMFPTYRLSKSKLTHGQHESVSSLYW